MKAGRLLGLVLSFVVATLLTLIEVGELLFDSLEVRPGEPAPVTLRLPFRSTPGAFPEKGSAEGTWIVPRGSVPDPADEPLVVAHEQARRHPIRAGHVLGSFVLYLLLALFLAKSCRDVGTGRGQLLRTQAGVAGLLLFVFGGAKVFLLLTGLPPFYLPVAAVPLWTAEYLTGRLAHRMNLSITLLTASLVGFDVTVIVTLFAVGIATLAAHGSGRYGRGLVSAGVWGGVAGAVVLLAIRLAFRGQFGVLADLRQLEGSILVGALTGGILSGLIALLLGFLGRLLLGVVSRSRLMDLTRIEQPLLKLMQERAPGSFEHSRAMANLAETAAAAVGADGLLTRVGAYYHDLGKSVEPKYFVENLASSELSPHDGIDAELSAEFIVGHVVDGTRILREEGIPEPVVEFAYTHHGTSVMEYFWKKCVENGNPSSLSEDHFRYPGMKPQTKETGILMLVDAVEASARTVDPPSRESFEEVVFHTVYSKLRQGQLDESGLTLENLRVIANGLVDTLVSAYHGRIRYPWQKEKEETGKVETAKKEDDGANAEAAPEPAPAPSAAPPTLEAPPAPTPASAEPAREPGGAEPDNVDEDW